MPASLRRIWIQLTADRRRFGILCAVFGAGLLLWARLIIVSNMTRMAVAEPPKGAAVENVEPKTKKPGGADKPGSKDPVKKDAKSKRTVAAQLWSRCTRDPFVISRQYFPKAAAALDVQQEAGKLPTEATEDASQKDARLVARLRELLGTLKLEAVMDSGPTSMAVFSGRRYQLGDQLPPLGSERVQFTLVEVRQRSVVLEFQGPPLRRFEMAMSLPVTDH